MRKKKVVAFVALLLGADAMVLAVLAATPASPPKRARPPQWSADVLDAFFPDAREKLVGERPAYQQTSSPRVIADDMSDNATSSEVPDAGKAAWSKLVAAETIETEIKRLAIGLSADVTTPGEFKGGAYKKCRRHFSLLAVLFAVAAEFDGNVRWQEAAAGLRDQFARAGQNAKVGTDQTYREAVMRKQELEDLVQGSRPQVPSADPVSDWSLVAGRAPLMQRLNAAHQERLTKWLANEREFESNRDEMEHEAQIIAMLAAVISRDGFEYWDDETYAGYARELREAAGDISNAAEAENYQAARNALDRATKACADCHDGYRS